jgi:hypothetical protein
MGVVINAVSPDGIKVGATCFILRGGQVCIQDQLLYPSDSLPGSASGVSIAESFEFGAA